MVWDLLQVLIFVYAVAVVICRRVSFKDTRWWGR
jgi:hypothetical protein